MKEFISAIINNHFRLTVLACIFTISIFAFMSDTTKFNDVAHKVINATLFLLYSVVFSKFYNRYDNNSDEKIWQNPISVSIYLGAITIGFALTITL